MTISLGNIVGNKVVGIASGLDSATLIKGLTAVRQVPITNLQDKITKNTAQNTAYGSLNTALTTLQSTLNFLRNPNDISQNAFASRTASVNSSTLTAASYLSAEASPGALIGSSAIEIGQLATARAQRSNSFSAQNTDATTSATGSYFTAGTFQVGSAIVNNVAGGTLSGYTLGSGDYTVSGSSTGILAGGGISNITVATAGQKGLQGTISGITGTYSGGNVTLSFVKNGVTYNSNAITANSTIGSDTGISSGTTITFTAATGDATSFQVTTASDVVINASQANTDTFATNINTALSAQSIYQSHQTSNFLNANVEAPLTGLGTSNIKFVSNSFDSSGNFGNISGFTVQKSTGSNGVISVTINGEVYTATGLGTTVNSNLTLQSSTTGKQLKINLGTAGVSLDLSTDASSSAVARSFDYAFGTRKLVNVTVASGDSLNNVVYNLNSLSQQTGASASITQVSSLSYLFSLKANNTGLANQYDIFDGSGVLTHTSLLSNPDTQAAQDAKLKIDGVEISRSTNTISDAISNVTLNLQATTPGYGGGSPDSVNVQVNNDVNTEATAVENFVNAYNAVRVFNAQQTARDPATGYYTKDATLSTDTLLNGLISQLSHITGSTISNATDPNFNALADLGITLSNYAGDSTNPATTNILSVDDTKLKSALTTNLDNVRQIFEAQSTTSSSKLSVAQTSNQATISSFKLKFDPTQVAGQQVQLLNSDGTDYHDAHGNVVYLNAAGTTISGKDGTAVAGLQFVYTGTGINTISVNINQGIADKLYNLTNSYTKTDGLIARKVQSNTTTNTQYTTRISQLQINLTAYTKSLQDTYSKLEQTISSANNLLDLLTAQTNVNNAKN